MTPQAAVLTGDLVKSTQAAPDLVDASIHDIERTADAMKGTASFTRFRGDGWQIYLAKPGLALATALLITARLKANARLETRISIGLGGADIDRAKDNQALDLPAANGGAFVWSGRGLDQMDKRRRLALGGDGVDPLHKRLVAILDDKVAKWSREQAEVAAILLSPGKPVTQEAVAEQLGISRQAVAARLRAADFSQINAAAIDFLFHFGADRDIHG